MPELRRLQAGLGARYSFCKAARLMAMFLPCSPPDHASVRNRLHRVTEKLQAKEAAPPADPVGSGSPRTSNSDIVVMIDGAHIRAAPGYQTRHLDVIVGKTEASECRPRRFGLAPSGTDRPLAHIRAALAAQGWQSGVPITVMSDGEATLPELVRRATGSEVTTPLTGGISPCASATPSKLCKESMC